jgi:hypothetical protein
MRDQTFSFFTNTVAGCGIFIAHSLFILFIIAEIHNIYIVLCIMSLQKEYQPVEMEEGIIAVAEAVPTPTAASMTAAAVPMIQVVAPATLPEGYTFEADIGGRVIVVTVVSKSE